MLKLNNMAERMREHCSRVYWEIDDINDNLEYMIEQLPVIHVSEPLKNRAENLLSEYHDKVIILRSEALELCEMFYLFIIDPEVLRVKLPEHGMRDILIIISDILDKQSTKFNDFINDLQKYDQDDTMINGLSILFCESGANMLRDKGEVYNSLNFIDNNYERYLYETNHENTTSN